MVEELRLKPIEDLILVRFAASHFLWKMVRRVVGVLVQVGIGTLKVEAVTQFLKKPAAEVGQWTAPAAGLFPRTGALPGRISFPTKSARLFRCTALTAVDSRLKTNRASVVRGCREQRRDP